MVERTDADTDDMTGDDRTYLKAALETGVQADDTMDMPALLLAVAAAISVSSVIESERPRPPRGVNGKCSGDFRGVVLLADVKQFTVADRTAEDW